MINAIKKEAYVIQGTVLNGMCFSDRGNAANSLERQLKNDKSVNKEINRWGNNPNKLVNK